MSTDRFHAPARRAGRLRRSDAEIHFEVTGAGPALVFAHGLGGNHLSWWQQVGHSAYFEQAATFNQAIDQFLDAIASAPTGAR